MASGWVVSPLRKRRLHSAIVVRHPSHRALRQISARVVTSSPIPSSLSRGFKLTRTFLGCTGPCKALWLCRGLVRTTLDKRKGAVVSFSVALIPLLALLALLVAAPATAAIELVPLVGGLSAPVYMTHARDGTGRLFIVEQAGRIRVLHPGATTSTVFLDLSGRVLSGGERGLLGLAFHPQFAVNRRFFVHYTRQPDGATVIAQYLASATIPDSAEPDETVLLMVPQPFANHNGGMLEFGPDGLLYIGLGDGGSANDPDNRAQNLDELLGKLLRIDVDPLPYASPPDNPFVGA
ncbi:MAG: hypothetical protein C3F12_10175, partial [Candidatus Methylomirabilota bacterium]